MMALGNSLYGRMLITVLFVNIRAVHVYCGTEWHIA